MPDFNINDFAVFKMIFTPVTGEDSVTIERKGEELYRPVNLAVGSWQLVVNAYKNASDTQETMSGAYVGPDGKPAIINIREQATTSGVVVLRPFINEGQGIFSWTINYPANYPAGFAGIEIQMEIISLSADGTDNYEDTISVGITGSRTLNSGYYRVIVSMIDGLRSTAQSSILHIYRNMTSSAVFNFTPENFVTPAMPPFTVSDAQSWAAAVASIQSGGRYIIDVTNSFPIPGTNLPTFGNVTGIHVTIRGINNPSSNSNHAISLNSQGTLLNINSNQEIILQDINLVGLSWNSPNNSPLVHVGSGASFTLRGTSSLQSNDHHDDVTFSSGGGGGVRIISGATFNMRGDASVSGNSSTWVGGGGVFVDGGTFNMYGGTISGNSAGDVSGGGVYIINGGTFNMYGGTISGNSADVSGGGVYVFNNSTFNMSGDASVIDNYAHGASSSQGNGGGVGVHGSIFTMSDNSKISDNTAYDSGGGVYIANTGGTFNMSGGTISDNLANTGGGVYVFNNSTFNMSGNASVIGNTVQGANNADPNGGGVGVFNSTFTMSNNSTISGNTADNDGGGIFINSSVFRISGGIVYGNDAGQLNNTSSNLGAALLIINVGTATYGPNGTGNDIPVHSDNNTFFRDATIRVINGVLQ
jgi:hypothetical protein